ncbi:MAG TPA: glycosyltransferase family 1 protein [Terriglobia bacterium]|nr:glycosyltransferase family 1 protein [Terriglobia bacterium]
MDWQRAWLVICLERYGVMATIAIDATYIVDPQPSGVSTYSRRLIETLATLESRHRFLICYRLSRLRERRRFLRLAPDSPGRERFSTTLFQEGLTPWLPWKAKLFHSLAQRPPAFRFSREVVTINDVFPITGADYSTAGFRKKFASLLLESAGRANAIISPSQYTANELTRLTGVSCEKIRVIPDGVDPPGTIMQQPARLAERERRVGKENRLVLMVGAIQTRKNTLGAVRALEGMPPNYRLVIAGSDGHGAGDTHDYIRRAGLGGRVMAVGYVPAEELARLYQAADVLLFPSFEEGFGLPVLEAMAFGVPVVAARTSSLPEVGGDAAIYVNPHDERDIREQTLRAAEDESLREQMIQRGLERVKQFTWRRTAEETLRVYDEVLAS